MASIHLGVNMNINMCSGVGRYHTNNPENPKAKPFAEINFPNIISMAKTPPCKPKQKAHWFIPSSLLSRHKETQMQQGAFYCLVADIDHEPPTVKNLLNSLLADWGEYEFLIYTSRSATESCQKTHILIPSVKLTGYRWTLAQRVLNDTLQTLNITPDRKTEDANQIIYLPNRGEYYSYYHHTGATFNPLKIFYSQMLKHHCQLETEKQAQQAPTRKLAKIAPKSSLIAEFKACIQVEELLLQAGYAQKGNLFRHPNSGTGNYSASVKDRKVFTLSSADPLYAKYAHDAFSVFVTLFHDGNRKAAMLDAGNNWLSIEGMSWNKYQQRAYRESQT